MNRIRMVSGVAIAGLYAWMLFQVSMMVAGIFFDSLMDVQQMGFLMTYSFYDLDAFDVKVAELSSLAKVLWFFSSMMGQLPMIAGVVILSWIFMCYRKGEFFTLANARRYQWIGGMFVLDVLVVMPMYDLFLSVAMTMDKPEGERWWGITFGSDNFQVLLCGLIVIIIAWIMAEASRMQEEQKLIV